MEYRIIITADFSNSAQVIPECFSSASSILNEKPNSNEVTSSSTTQPQDDRNFIVPNQGLTNRMRRYFAYSFMKEYEMFE